MSQNLTDASNMTISKANYGWQGGRNPSLIKAFLAYGDPTADYPGMLAPLSYPMMGNFTGLVENYNTSYQAIITEAYAGCSTLNPYSNWTNPLQSGTYNSWAASQYINVDFDPIPLSPGYGTVGDGSDANATTMKVWTGVVTPDTQCDILAAAGCGQYWSSNNYAYWNCYQAQQAACDCQAVLSDPNFPQLTDLKGNPFTCGENYSKNNWFTWYHADGLVHVSHAGNTDYSSRPGYCGPKGYYRNNAQCHVGEWYYNVPYTIYNHNYWLDHPSPKGCVAGEAMSMVPGGLNIGFLDGSVRTIDREITGGAWKSLLTGQAPVDDVSNW